MIKHIKLTIKGRVQGVWFRASTKQEANNLRIHGFVRNLLNGDVYIEAEETEDQLQKFIVWCEKGPTNARVHEVIKTKGNLEYFSKFDIK